MSVMHADPAGFSRLVCLLIERRITVRFVEGELRWRAPDGAVDREVVRLLRRFKESLRQAWGLERLTDDDA